MSESFDQGYVDMYRSKSEGMDNLAERDASGRTSTSFRKRVQKTLKPAILRR